MNKEVWTKIDFDNFSEEIEDEFKEPTKYKFFNPFYKKEKSMNKKVYIIGGGTSLKGFDFSKLKGKDCIAVNKAIFDVPNAKIFISMDYTITNKINLSRVTQPKVFVVSMFGNIIQEISGKFINTKRNKTLELNEFDIIIKSYKQKGIGLEWNDFRNGANSGFCALQMAVLLGYQEINLLGIDLLATENTHYHNGYNQNRQKFIDKMNRDYVRFVGGVICIKYKLSNVKVYSCSKISKLNDYLEYKEL